MVVFFFATPFQTFHMPAKRPNIKSLLYGIDFRAFYNIIIKKVVNLPSPSHFHEGKVSPA